MADPLRRFPRAMNVRYATHTDGICPTSRHRHQPPRVLRSRVSLPRSLAVFDRLVSADDVRIFRLSGNRILLA